MAFSISTRARIIVAVVFLSIALMATVLGASKDTIAMIGMITVLSIIFAGAYFSLRQPV